MYQTAWYCLRNRGNVSLRIMGLNKEAGRAAKLQRTLRRPHPRVQSHCENKWCSYTLQFMDPQAYGYSLAYSSFIRIWRMFFLHDAMSFHFPWGERLICFSKTTTAHKDFWAVLWGAIRSHLYKVSTHEYSKYTDNIQQRFAVSHWQTSQARIL